MSEAEKELQELQTEEPVERPPEGEPWDIDRETSDEPSRRHSGNLGDDDDEEDAEDEELPVPGMEPEPNQREPQTEIEH